MGNLRARFISQGAWNASSRRRSDLNHCSNVRGVYIFFGVVTSLFCKTWCMNNFHTDGKPAAPQGCEIG